MFRSLIQTNSVSEKFNFSPFTIKFLYIQAKRFSYDRLIFMLLTLKHLVNEQKAGIQLQDSIKKENVTLDDYKDKTLGSFQE